MLFLIIIELFFNKDLVASDRLLTSIKNFYIEIPFLYNLILCKVLIITK